MFLKTSASIHLLMYLFAQQHWLYWVSGSQWQRIQLKLGLDGATIGSTTEKSGEVMTSVIAESRGSKISSKVVSLLNCTH